MAAAMGITLGFSFIIDTETFVWTNTCRNQWNDDIHYIILSWHSETGAHLANTTIAGGTNILLPPGDEAAPSAVKVRCVAGIIYAYAKADLNFNDIVKPEQRPCSFHIKFFLSSLPRQLMIFRMQLTIFSLLPHLLGVHPTSARSLLPYSGRLSLM